MTAIEENARKADGMTPYRVLSIDGGGMRGIYTAAFLDHLLRQYARLRNVEQLDLGKGFDMIVGTSTGAILGCAAAIGRPMAEMVALYEENGHKIFPHRIRDGILSPIYRIFTGGKYVRRGDAALRKALDEQLEDITMRAVLDVRGISLLIPTVFMGTHRAWVFKKTPKSGLRDDNYRLADVCLASSAAPIYRSLGAVENPDLAKGNFGVFADGGLWANNPVLVAMIDALKCAEADRPIEIFSMGTCARPAGEPILPMDVHRSMLEWKLGAAIGPLSIDAQEGVYDQMVHFLSEQFAELGRQVSHVRIPQGKVPAALMPYLGLDENRPKALKALIAQGHEDAIMVKSRCDRKNDRDGQMIHRLLTSLPAMPKAGISRKIFK
jgi:patatin-like phospholipase/acyl hydrolase